jgi:two-component system NtrC family response regulator
MDRVKTLVVDDEAETWLRILQRRVSAHGVDLEPETNPSKVLERVEKGRPDVVLLDVMFPDTYGKAHPIGVELLAQLNALAPGLPVVMFTVTLADDSSSVGASDFPGAAFVFSKSVFSELLPDDQDPYADLARCLKNAVSEAGLRSQLDERVGWVVGHARAMQDLALGVLRVAPTDLPVLICGESGTGKELVAQTLHRMSHRSERAFLKVNCGALSDETLESALFGHEKGAFTGAATAKAGLFEEADGGTLLLDEVQSMSPRMQQTLLRALQEGVIRRMGSTRERRIDVRILAATNEDLESKVAQGSFRADLYYRLNRVPLVVPPLRERKGDLAALFARFVLSANRKIGRSVSSQCRADVLRLLEAHDWPGNIRELESAIDAAVALAGSNLLTPADFPHLAVPTHIEVPVAESRAMAAIDLEESGSRVIESSNGDGDLKWARLKDIKGEPRRRLLLDYISRQASLTGRRPTSSSLALSLGTSADNLRRILSEAGIRLRDIGGP